MNVDLLQQQGIAQAVQYITSFTENVLNVSCIDCANDVDKALEVEAKGGLTQFAPKAIQIEGVGTYHPALPSQSLYVKPTTMSNSQTERAAFSYDLIMSKDRMEMANPNVVNSYLNNLSRHLYSDDKDRLLNELKSVRHLDVYSLENTLNSQQDIISAVEKVDHIINTIHADKALPAFMAAGYNSLYFAMIMNFLSLERFIYAINWFHINSANITQKLYQSLFKHYEELRTEVADAEIDENGNYKLQDSVRFRLVSIAHFFERLKHIQKKSVFDAIYSQESEESLRHIMLKIRSDQS